MKNQFLPRSAAFLSAGNPLRKPLPKNSPFPIIGNSGTTEQTFYWSSVRKDSTRCGSAPYGTGRPDRGSEDSIDRKFLKQVAICHLFVGGIFLLLAPVASGLCVVLVRGEEASSAVLLAVFASFFWQRAWANLMDAAAMFRSIGR